MRTRDELETDRDEERREAIDVLENAVNLFDPTLVDDSSDERLAIREDCCGLYSRFDQFLNAVPENEQFSHKGRVDVVKDL